MLQVPADQGVSGDECNPKNLFLIHIITRLDTGYISTSHDTSIPRDSRPEDSQLLNHEGPFLPHL